MAFKICVADDSRVLGDDEKNDVRRLPLEEEGRLSPVLSVAGIVELLENKLGNFRGMSTESSRRDDRHSRGYVPVRSVEPACGEPKNKAAEDN
jgi:hypothetical protein